jgi:phosphoribosyl 1,2-cyclic phosphodiesterase
MMLFLYSSLVGQHAPKPGPAASAPGIPYGVAWDVLDHDHFSRKSRITERQWRLHKVDTGSTPAPILDQKMAEMTMDPLTGQTLTFWGVRGSVPTPRRDNLGYGGNTSCLEIRSADHEIAIFDAGTGIRNLGEALLRQSQGRGLKLHVFLTHYHWDHIQGLPLFAPLYQAENEIIFHASERLGSIQEHLRGQMNAPYFPVKFEDIPARIRFVEMDAQSVPVGDLRVSGFPLNHPQGASGFRVESPAGVIVYASDLEPGHGELDRMVREAADGVDTLVYDTQFTPEEYLTHQGWGHSHWREAAAVASDAHVQELILFHHDPSHNDDMVTQMQNQTRALFERTTAAKEGRVIAYARRPAGAGL